MSVLHLVKVRFDRRFPGATQEWFDRRVAFFKEYTHRSLLRQTTKDWGLWINFDDETTRDMVMPRLDPHWGLTLLTFALREGAFKGFHSLGDGPPILSSAVVEHYDYVYITRIDSDDLFAQDALELVRSVTPSVPGAVETSMFRRGYLHDVNTGRVSVYCSDSSPFHTLMVPRDVFSDPARYGELFHRVGDHSLVSGCGLKCHGLPDWKFTVLIHGDNFLSDMTYKAERGTPVERGWTVPRFLSQPVVFDVDDFCDDDPHRTVLDDLDTLAHVYPNFACTLFTIPEKTAPDTLRRALEGRPWLELGVHGKAHYPNQELRNLTPTGLYRHLARVAKDHPEYAKVFRPPGWYITPGHLHACKETGFAVALHVNDREMGRDAGPVGYYYCDARTPHWHGHTHDVCGNWLRRCLPDLLTKWPKTQAFGKVSDAVLVPQR